MTATEKTDSLPDYNITGQDFSSRDHLTYSGPIIDIHTHVLITRPGDPKSGAPSGQGPGASISQAETMLDEGDKFGIVKTYTMCFPDDIPWLKDRFGKKIGFNGAIMKKKIEDADTEAYRSLERFLELGVEIIKFWAAPRGKERGLFVDAPWRIEAAKRAQAAGIKVMMVHVADPDIWFDTVYTDPKIYGSKQDEYIGLRRLLEEFPDLQWIGAHMGGDPEHPDHLEQLLETYPNFYMDTSATKWQVREVSKRREAIASLIGRYPDRFLFGTDLVTRHHLEREHYISRYWCQRTLWESDWEGRSPIKDPDHNKESDDGTESSILRGVNLPKDVLEKVYYTNAVELLGLKDLAS